MTRRERSVGAKPLRVCHLAYTFYENDNRVTRYAEALAGRGDEVEVIALRRDGQAACNRTAAGIVVRRIQRRSVDERVALTYLMKLLWFLAKATCVLSVLQVRRRYDVVHVHNVPDFLVFAAIVPKVMGARIILDIHDILPELYSGKFGSSDRSPAFRALLAVERLSCGFADHVIVANHLWRDKLVARAVPAEMCTVILNYPDLQRFAPAHKPATGRFVFLYPGTLNHHQGLDVAIRAFAQVRHRMSGAELHIYGEGPARRELAGLIASLALGERVRLMDRVPLDEIAQRIAAADFGVVPKRADGFGNEAFSTKILEFMASGVPVIVSRTRVDAYYFSDEVVRFFTSGDEADLANAFLWAFEHRGGHGPLIRRARDFAVRHSWQANVSGYLQLVSNAAAAADSGQTAVPNASPRV
jgi:glycosyltransferase involved in cell wall biosynthesis